MILFHKYIHFILYLVFNWFHILISVNLPTEHHLGMAHQDVSLKSVVMDIEPWV